MRWWLASLWVGCAGGDRALCASLVTAQADCVGELPSDADQARCEASLAACSDADRAVLTDYAACLSQSACEAGDTGWYGCTAALVALEDPACGS
jgi:hypothetical protein